MTDPCVTFDPTDSDCPFVLAVCADEGQVLQRLTEAQLLRLDADVLACKRLKARHMCAHSVTEQPFPIGDGAGVVLECFHCGAEVVEEPDGTLVPVGES